MSDRPKTLTLRFDPPLEFNGAIHSEVTLREPTGAEYDDAAREARNSQLQFGIARKLLVTIGKLPALAVGKVPLSQVVEVDRFVGQFLLAPEPGPEPGPEPPQEGDEELFAKLVFREPTLDEMDRAGRSSLPLACLVAFTTGISIAEAKRIPLSRMREADAYFSGFQPSSPPTGGS